MTSGSASYAANGIWVLLFISICIPVVAERILLGSQSVAAYVSDINNILAVVWHKEELKHIVI